jgi:hypothetical protein
MLKLEKSVRGYSGGTRWRHGEPNERQNDLTNFSQSVGADFDLQRGNDKTVIIVECAVRIDFRQWRGPSVGRRLTD